MRLKRLKPWLAYAMALGFLAWCVAALRADVAQLSFVPVLRAWDLLLFAALLSLLNYALRIVRWRVYLATLGYPLGLRFAALTYTAGFAFTLSPGKVGELARARYYERLAIPMAHVAGAFLVERLLDLLAILALAALILSGGARYHPAIWSTAVLLGGTLTFLTLVPWERIAAAPGRTMILPRQLRPAVAGAVASVAAASRLLRPDRLILGFILGLVAWGLEGVGLGVMGQMFPGHSLPLGDAVGIYAVAVLAGAMSLLPGGLGSTEAVMTALLAARGLPLAESVLLTLTCRLVTLWLAVALGWGAVWMLRLRLPQAVPSWR